MKFIPRREKDTRRVADINAHIVPRIENGQPNKMDVAKRTMSQHFIASEKQKKAVNSLSNPGSVPPPPLEGPSHQDAVKASKTLSRGY